MVLEWNRIKRKIIHGVSNSLALASECNERHLDESKSHKKGRLFTVFTVN
jgi:hypothetical protein